MGSHGKNHLAKARAASATVIAKSLAAVTVAGLLLGANVPAAGQMRDGGISATQPSDTRPASREPGPGEPGSRWMPVDEVRTLRVQRAPRPGAAAPASAASRDVVREDRLAKANRLVEETHAATERIRAMSDGPKKDLAIRQLLSEWDQAAKGLADEVARTKKQCMESPEDAQGREWFGKLQAASEEKDPARQRAFLDEYFRFARDRARKDPNLPPQARDALEKIHQQEEADAYSNPGGWLKDRVAKIEAEWQHMDWHRREDAQMLALLEGVLKLFEKLHEHLRQRYAAWIPKKGPAAASQTQAGSVVRDH